MHIHRKPRTVVLAYKTHVCETHRTNARTPDSRVLVSERDRKRERERKRVSAVMLGRDVSRRAPNEYCSDFPYRSGGTRHSSQQPASAAAAAEHATTTHPNSPHKRNTREPPPEHSSADVFRRANTRAKVLARECVLACAYQSAYQRDTRSMGYSVPLRLQCDWWYTLEHGRGCQATRDGRARVRIVVVTTARKSAVAQVLVTINTAVVSNNIRSAIVYYISYIHHQTAHQ